MAKEEAADGTTPACRNATLQRGKAVPSRRQKQRERARGRTSALDEEERDKGVELEERQHEGLRRERQQHALVQEQLADRRDE